MNDIREFECDIRNVEGDLFECDSIVGGWGANALASPTGNSSARGVRKSSEALVTRADLHPNMSVALCAHAACWHWPFFGLSFGRFLA